MPTIKELAQTVGFKGPSHRRTAEPSSVKTLSPIDNSVPGQPTIRTSVDCYVSGQYVQRKGTIEVTQRYVVFVSYSTSTQLQTMNQVRDRILNDFQSKYGASFNISGTFVNPLPVPTQPVAPSRAEAKPMELYGGSQMFRRMTRAERVRYETSTQTTQARLNIKSIKNRYRIR